jgi:hypothetical protein
VTSYPHKRLILARALFLVFAVIAVTATLYSSSARLPTRAPVGQQKPDTRPGLVDHGTVTDTPGQLYLAPLTHVYPDFSH